MAKIVPGDGVLLGKWMAVRHDDEDILGSERQEVVCTVPNLAVDYDEIESAPIEPLHQAAPAFVDDADFDVGKVLRVGQKRVAQRTGRQRHVEADAKAAGSPRPRALMSTESMSLLIRCMFSKKTLAGVGRTDAMAMPFENETPIRASSSWIRLLSVEVLTLSSDAAL